MTRPPQSQQSGDYWYRAAATYENADGGTFTWEIPGTRTAVLEHAQESAATFHDPEAREVFVERCPVEKWERVPQPAAMTGERP
jgi:hypothetical protein